MTEWQAKIHRLPNGAIGRVLWRDAHDAHNLDMDWEMDFDFDLFQEELAKIQSKADDASRLLGLEEKHKLAALLAVLNAPDDDGERLTPF